MSFKTVIAGVAAVAIVAGTALVSTDASAQRGGHGGGGHGGGGVGGGFRGGGGVGGEAFAAFAVSAAGMAAGAGSYPCGLYPWPYEYYYGPSCGYVHVNYYRNGRIHWRWVYECE